MAKALYLVILSREKWWVDIEGRSYGPFEARAAAALEARALARLAGQGGREAEVLVPDEDGRYWVIWSSRFDGVEGETAFTPRRVGR